MHPILQAMLTEAAKTIGVAIAQKLVERADNHIFDKEKKDAKPQSDDASGRVSSEGTVD